jgi:hypothetical protein
MYSITPCVIESYPFVNEWVIEVTEHGKLVNKFIFSPDYNGDVDYIRISGINLNLLYVRYCNERKFMMFDVSDCELDAWDEYIDFTIAH